VVADAQVGNDGRERSCQRAQQQGFAPAARVGASPTSAAARAVQPG
jgi:hypothetical protein